MSYIKNNKVFLFLFTILLALIVALFYQFINPDSMNGPLENGNATSNATQISNFHGQFSDDRLAVELSWNINRGKKQLENVELVYGEGRRKDVTDLRSISMPLDTYNILTGNNEFQLIATFSDGTVLDKTVFVYINEAYDFSVTAQNMDTKTIVTATYYFDKRRPLNTPSVFFNGAQANFTMAFVSSEKVEEKDNRIKMKVVYEVLYNDAKRGDYNLNLTYAFEQYNLEINYPISFRVAVGVDENA